MRLFIEALTDVGRERDHNEDSVHADVLHRFVIVADGMGGHNAGEVASALAVKTMGSALRPLYPENPAEALPEGPAGGWLRWVITRSNRAIREAAAANPEQANMGTTVVSLMRIGDELELGHVGDSRCYRLRQGRLEQLTKDHSAAAQHEELTDDDDLMRDFLGDQKVPTNVITRALGVSDEVEVDTRREKMVAEDVYLLCSDGLTGMVKDQAIQLILRQSPDLRTACQSLVQAANAGGGMDNITVALAIVLPDE